MARFLPNTVDQARAGSQAHAASVSSGIASSDVSADWWSAAETDLFTQWGKAFENYNYSFYNPYFDYFYTGQDVNVQIEATENILPIYSFGYNIQQQKTPLYGFWSYTYDAMLRGTRIVTGAFSLVSTEPFLLTKTIAEASVQRAKLSVQTGGSPLNAIRGLDEDESRIDRYWRRNFDSNLDMGDQNLFSVHPPFNIIITYGLQETSLVSNDPNARVAELQANGYGQDAIMTDFNERLIKNPSNQLDRQVLLENVEIISKNVEYNVDGDPLLETYTFMARDERLLNIKDYSSMTPAVPDPPIDDDNIGVIGVGYRGPH